MTIKMTLSQLQKQQGRQVTCKLNPEYPVDLDRLIETLKQAGWGMVEIQSIYLVLHASDEFETLNTLEI